MKKQELIPIGVLSKLTNVHIQSLRYYEKLGILKPAYIDAESRYRYYTFSQIRLVEAIQYCVELDIPLKDFNLFISDSGQTIDYAALISYGRKMAYHKIETIKNKMKHFDSIELEMLHSQKCSDDTVAVCFLPEKTYYLMPYCGTQTEPAFRKAVIRLLNEVYSKGYKTGFDISLIAKYKDNSVEQFVGTDILNYTPKQGGNKNIFCVPAGDQYCLKRSESNILDAPEIFRPYLKNTNCFTVIETDFFSENYAYDEPNFEIRCMNGGVYNDSFGV